MALQALTAGPHQKYAARVDRVYPDQPSFAGDFEGNNFTTENFWSMQPR